MSEKEPWWSDKLPEARTAVDAARADGHTFMIGPEPGMIHIIAPDDAAVSPEKPSRKYLIDRMQESEAFRIAVKMTLRDDGVQEGERFIEDYDLWPCAVVMQVKYERENFAEQVAKVKAFMAERYPNLPFLWEGEYIEMSNFGRYFGVAYSCKNIAAFETIKDQEFFEMGLLIDNIDYD